MNTIEHENLFTELTPAQAETVAAGLDDFLDVSAFYGVAAAKFAASGVNSISGSLEVKDRHPDGKAVYAKFQGRTTKDGPIITSSPAFFDRKGAAGNGTLSLVNVSFGKNIYIRYVRLVIYRQQSGADPSKASKWADLDSIFD